MLPVKDGVEDKYRNEDDENAIQALGYILLPAWLVPRVVATTVPLEVVIVTLAQILVVVIEIVEAVHTADGGGGVEAFADVVKLVAIA